MLPFWHAQVSTPPGHEFTGNLTISPDYMQYRVWERLSVREGPIVSNTFTIEPNRRHLPVFYYWAIGHTARALGVHENTVRNWEERGLLRAVRLPGSGFRRFAAADVERLRAEMFEQLAPATEGPIVNPGRERSGRLVFGDADE